MDLMDLSHGEKTLTGEKFVDSDGTTIQKYAYPGWPLARSFGELKLSGRYKVMAPGREELEVLFVGADEYYGTAPGVVGQCLIWLAEAGEVAAKAMEPRPLNVPGAKMVVVGIDAEGDFDDPRGLTQTLQLCVGPRVLIVHSKSGGLKSEELAEMLNKARIEHDGRKVSTSKLALLFAGAELCKDSLDLVSDPTFGPPGTIKLHHALDLTLALGKEFYKFRPIPRIGLRDMLNFCRPDLPVEWQKDKDITLSRWSSPALTLKQLKYAALDAWASRVVGEYAVGRVPRRGCSRQFEVCPQPERLLGLPVPPGYLETGKATNEAGQTRIVPFSLQDFPVVEARALAGDQSAICVRAQTLQVNVLPPPTRGFLRHADLSENYFVRTAKDYVSKPREEARTAKLHPHAELVLREEEARQAREKKEREEKERREREQRERLERERQEKARKEREERERRAALERGRASFIHQAKQAITIIGEDLGHADGNGWVELSRLGAYFKKEDRPAGFEGLNLRACFSKEELHEIFEIKDEGGGKVFVREVCTVSRAFINKALSALETLKDRGELQRYGWCDLTKLGPFIPKEERPAESKGLKDSFLLPRVAERFELHQTECGKKNWMVRYREYDLSQDDVEGEGCCCTNCHWCERCGGHHYPEEHSEDAAEEPEGRGYDFRRRRSIMDGEEGHAFARSWAGSTVGRRDEPEDDEGEVEDNERDWTQDYRSDRFREAAEIAFNEACRNGQMNDDGWVQSKLLTIPSHKYIRGGRLESFQKLASDLYEVTGSKKSFFVRPLRGSKLYFRYLAHKAIKQIAEERCGDSGAYVSLVPLGSRLPKEIRPYTKLLDCFRNDTGYFDLEHWDDNWHVRIPG
jgi:hypothetical protein